MIDKGICDKGFIWNPSICECECDKLYDIRQYLDWKIFELDWKSCECRKKLIDKLVEECSENIDGNEMIYNGTVSDYKKSMQFLYNIRIIRVICHCFLNNHWQ